MHVLKWKMEKKKLNLPQKAQFEMFNEVSMIVR